MKTFRGRGRGRGQETRIRPSHAWITTASHSHSNNKMSDIPLPSHPMGTELPATINSQREEIAQLPRTKAEGRELEDGRVGRDRIGSDDENEMIREEKDERLKQLQSQSLQRGDLDGRLQRQGMEFSGLRIMTAWTWSFFILLHWEGVWILLGIFRSHGLIILHYIIAA